MFGKAPVVELILEYKGLIFAVAIATVYLLVLRPRLKARVKEPNGTVYVCDDCGELDCHCHKVDDPEES